MKVPIALATVLVALLLFGTLITIRQKRSADTVESPPPTLSERTAGAFAASTRQRLPLRFESTSPPGHPSPTTPATVHDDPGADPVQGASDAIEDILRNLKSSGEARGPWVAKAKASMEILKGGSALASLAQVKSEQCFAGGCALQLSSIDMDKSRNAVREVDESEAFVSWPGGKYRVGPLPSSGGQFTTNVILLRPE